MNEPMTDVQLAEVRVHLALLQPLSNTAPGHHRMIRVVVEDRAQVMALGALIGTDVPALLNEVERLETELATVSDKKALARAYSELQGFAQRETVRAAKAEAERDRFADNTDHWRERGKAAEANVQRVLARAENAEAECGRLAVDRAAVLAAVHGWQTGDAAAEQAMTVIRHILTGAPLDEEADHG